MSATFQFFWNKTLTNMREDRMASMGKRVRAVLGKLTNKDPESIKDTDQLSDYGYARSNLFSLLQKIGEKLYGDELDLNISEADIVSIGNIQTVKDLEDLIGKMSRKNHKEARGNESL